MPQTLMTKGRGSGGGESEGVEVSAIWRVIVEMVGQGDGDVYDGSGGGKG